MSCPELILVSQDNWAAVNRANDVKVVKFCCPMCQKWNDITDPVESDGKIKHTVVCENCDDFYLLKLIDWSP